MLGTFRSGNNSKNQKSSSKSYCLQRIYYMPGTVLGILQKLSNRIFTRNLWSMVIPPLWMRKISWERCRHLSGSHR